MRAATRGGWSRLFARAGCGTREASASTGSGALIGFCSVELASGMVANDLRVMTGKNGPWAATPAQKQFDPNGNPRLDPNGKAIFKPIIEFRDRATADRIGALVIELVWAAYLDAIDAAWCST